MRHSGQIGGDDAAIDILAHGDGQPRFGFVEDLRLKAVAQMDGFAAVVRHLDADSILAGHALDENAFSAHRKAKIVGEAGDARVLDARFRLEFVCGDHRAGIDLHHLAAHVELGAFLHQYASLFAQLVLAHSLRSVAGVEQSAGRKLEAAHVFGRDCGRVRLGVGTQMDGDFIGWPCVGGGNKICLGSGRFESSDS